MQIVDLVIKNGTIVTSAGRFQAGIAIDEGRIAAIGKEVNLPKGDSVIDAKGKFILPGIIDAHVHFRDPGDTEKEDFATGTAAAAAGGVTTVLDMPNTRPPVLAISVLKDKIKSVQHKAHVDFGLYAGAGVRNLKELDALARGGVVAFKTFMPAGRANSASDDISLFRVFEKLASMNLPCSVHAESSDLIDYMKEKLLAEGRKDALAHAESRPNFVEEQSISKALIVAKVLGTRIHIAHLTTREGVRLIDLAKKAEQKISAETCPQYLLMTAEEMRHKGPYAKTNPPLRSADDVDELWKALRNGTIDILASDHAPHTKADKDLGFANIWEASSGMPGVETMLSLMLTKVNKGKLSLEVLARAMSESVSRIFGLYPRKGTIQVGSDADLSLIDLREKKTIRADDLHTKARDVTVYDGWKIKGAPIATIVRGRLVMWKGQILSPPGSGQFIARGANEIG